METDFCALATALTPALNAVNRARNQVGSLHLCTNFRDPIIFDQIAHVYDRLAQAEGMLEALRSDVDVWLKEETSAE